MKTRKITVGRLNPFAIAAKLVNSLEEGKLIYSATRINTPATKQTITVIVPEDEVIEAEVIS